MIPSTASCTAIEGCGGVPPIRPLETLHNALSLRQLDAFLEVMTAAPLFRTPASSPPKCPTPSGAGSSAAAVGSAGSSVATAHCLHGGHHPPLRLQSPSNSVGWSGPPSFVSSSGPSSPGASASGSFAPDIFSGGSVGAGAIGSGMGDVRAGADDLSSLSASLVSSDGYTDIAASLAHMFPPVLDQDLSSVGILLEEDVVASETAVGAGQAPGSPLNVCSDKLTAATTGDSGEVTPVSVSASSEFDFGAEPHKESEEPKHQKRRRPEEEEEIMGGPEGDVGIEFSVPVPPSTVPHTTGGSTSLRGLSKTVESMALVEKRGRVGSCLGTKFVGRWVMESNENLEAFGHGEVEAEDFFPDVSPQGDEEIVTTTVLEPAEGELETAGSGLGLVEESLGLPGVLEPDAADEEDRTITSSMTATSPARKSIFQVFGSPVSRPLPSSVLSTSAGKESKLSTSLTPSTESDITQIEVEFTKPQSALSMSLKSPPIEEGTFSTSPLSTVSLISASPGASTSVSATNPVRRPPTKMPVISAFSREFRVYSSSKAGSLASEVTLPSPSPTADQAAVTPEESHVSAGLSEPASGPDTSSSSDALSSVRALDGCSPSHASSIAHSSHPSGPLLTLASSLTDKPCIQRGFKVSKE